MRYILKTGNIDAGADTNLALTTFYVDATPTDAQVAAQLCAFAQGMSSAASSYVAGIDVGADAPGPTLPVPFPVTEYAALAAGDAGLVAMTDYGTAYGVGVLTARGVGMVLSKRTATPGRTGRGRLTTPWLRTTAINANGDADFTNLQFLADSWDCYLSGIHTTFPTAASVDLDPYIYPAVAPILLVTVTSRLGRVRSRGK